MDQKTINDNAKFNPKEIKTNLIFTSLFLTYYEILKNVIVDRIGDLYNFDYKDGRFINSQEYKDEIINRKSIKDEPMSIFLSSCQWLLENNVISNNDHTLIMSLTSTRNRIAHDIPKFLFDSEYSIDQNWFIQLKELTLKIDKWWIAEFDMTLDPRFDKMEINIDKISSCKGFLLDYLFNVANLDMNEFNK